MTEESRVSQIEQKLSRVSGIVTISDKDPRGIRLGERSKRQIQHWLQTEARLLIDKQQREREKQQRLKKIQEEFERKREVKSRQIEQKLTSSQQKRRRNVVNVQKKLENVSKRHSSVLTRVQDEQSREIQKQFDQRKTFELNTARPSSKMSTSNLSHSSSRSRYKFSLPEGPKDEEIQRQMIEIDLKLQKAKTTKHQKNMSLLNRIHNHNTSEIQRAQMKASQQAQEQISTFSKKIAEKIQHADRNKKRVNSSIQKRQEDKEKVYTQKLRAYQNNLRSIESRKLQQMEQLNKKFNQSHMFNKSWRDQKGQAYHRMFMANISVLQQQKISKADRIIQKHQQISEKNRVYKQRKDSLFKAIKCNPTQL